MAAAHVLATKRTGRRGTNKQHTTPGARHKQQGWQQRAAQSAAASHPECCLWVCASCAGVGGACCTPHSTPRPNMAIIGQATCTTHPHESQNDAAGRDLAHNSKTVGNTRHVHTTKCCAVPSNSLQWWWTHPILPQMVPAHHTAHTHSGNTTQQQSLQSDTPCLELGSSPQTGRLSQPMLYTGIRRPRLLLLNTQASQAPACAHKHHPPTTTSCSPHTLTPSLNRNTPPASRPTPQKQTGSALGWPTASEDTTLGQPALWPTHHSQLPPSHHSFPQHAMNARQCRPCCHSS